MAATVGFGPTYLRLTGGLTTVVIHRNKMVLVERLELPLLLRVKQVPLPLGDTRVAG